MATNSDRNVSVEQFKQMWPEMLAANTAPLITGYPVHGFPLEHLQSLQDNAIGIPTADQQKQLDSLMKTEAVKADDGKPDWSLVPFESLEGMVKVLQFGAKKYDSWNWTTGGGFKWMRLFGSTMRHMFAWARGQDLDPESGLSHIYHAQCNLLFLAHYVDNKDKFDKDDRNVR